jgi:hypothetical protein
MVFNPMGFALASALTRDMPDRERATQMALAGALLPNPVGFFVAQALADAEAGESAAALSKVTQQISDALEDLCAHAKEADYGELLGMLEAVVTEVRDEQQKQRSTAG